MGKAQTSMTHLRWWNGFVKKRHQAAPLMYDYLKSCLSIWPSSDGNPTREVSPALGSLGNIQSDELSFSKGIQTKCVKRMSGSLPWSNGIWTRIGGWLLRRYYHNLYHKVNVLLVKIPNLWKNKYTRAGAIIVWVNMWTSSKNGNVTRQFPGITKLASRQRTSKCLGTTGAKNGRNSIPSRGF